MTNLTPKEIRWIIERFLLRSDRVDIKRFLIEQRIPFDEKLIEKIIGEIAKKVLIGRGSQ